ncbi:MAG: Tn3 family transposase, partial [Isosphaeraceae bacterium]
MSRLHPGPDGSSTRCGHPAIQRRDRDAEVLGHVPGRHPHLGPLLKGRINRDRILRHWDELLRVAGALKLGWVTAS